jgi:hypothetical protein
LLSAVVIAVPARRELLKVFCPESERVIRTRLAAYSRRGKNFVLVEEKYLGS